MRSGMRLRSGAKNLASKGHCAIVAADPRLGHDGLLLEGVEVGHVGRNDDVVAGAEMRDHLAVESRAVWVVSVARPAARTFTW